MRRLFLRSFALAFIAFTLFFGLEFFLEWRHAGYPGWGSTSYAGLNQNSKLVDVLSPMARAYNNILAMLVGMIGLAIPLTANMHTPKLIEMFLSDRINRVVLTYITFGAAHVLWVDFMIGPDFAPTIAIGISVIGALIGWSLLLPYFFYVIRFIDPSRLVVRLRDVAMKIVHNVADRKRDAAEAQQEALRRIGQLGTIIIKSLDRNDRDVAAEGAWGLKLMIDDYHAQKSRMPKEWFVVDRADFVGFSDEALEMLSENKAWYEMKCLQQVEHGFLRALHGPTDTVSVFSDAVRVIACRCHENHDEQSLRLAVRFFNNFLREAIKARNLRAVYDVFHQYRKFARAIVDRPELLREIGRHFVYYAGMARIYGMVFAPQLALFDLGFIARRAYERASPAAPDLLQHALSLPHRTKEDVHSMAVKAKIILGGFMVENKLTAEAELVRKNLSDIDAVEIDRAEAELLGADRSFFEVTDRQLNLEYVPPERRQPLQTFCDSLLATQR
ncbi:MAG: DUF2254 family protein [Kofleriaceae bacterium]